MIYASLFSGIEAATVAWQPLGWKPAFFAEIEKFPARVLAHHYPDVPNYGDVTKLQEAVRTESPNGETKKEWPYHAAIDLIVGGSPCQSFSIAGLRRGLADPRGNLMLFYIGVVKHYRPRWLVWENVPGVLSADGGRAFATLLRGLEEIGYSCAWRVLDAQYVRTQLFPRAVPQRRRRLYLVGYLGDWRCGAQVLFERKGLSGHHPPRREARQETTGTTPYRFVSFGEYARTATASTIKSRDSRDATDLIAFDSCAGGDTNLGLSTNISPTLTKQDGRIAIFACKTANTKSNGLGISDEGVAYTLDTSPNQAIASQSFVRRLTPLECERLMGFPDGYTAIPNASLSARYKALGNSMAVNCMQWIGQRIAIVENHINNKEAA